VVRATREVYSGAYFHERDVLGEVRSAIRSGMCNALVFYSIDRLSRSVAHLSILADECERYGAVMHCVTEDFDRSPQGTLLRSVQGYVAEIEREKIRERTTRGRRTKASNGSLSFKRKLYGYDLEPHTGRRIINEAEAAIVREIFDRTLDGESTGAIANDLTRRGIPTAKGNTEWWKSAINKILRNVTYSGKTYAFRYSTSRKGRSQIITANDRDKWVELPGISPAIVTEHTFNEAEARIQSNKAEKRRPARTRYLLRGKIRCGTCGRSLVPHTGGKADHRSYRCWSRGQGTLNCGTKSLTAHRIEDSVWQMVLKIVKDETYLQTLMAPVERTKDNRPMIDAIDRRVKTLNAEIGKLITRSADAPDSLWDRFKKEIGTKQNELDRIIREREALSRPPKARKDLKATLAEWRGTIDRLGFEEQIDVLTALGVVGEWNGNRLKLSVYGVGLSDT
jgi:site-specific DNA recombinase